MITVFIPVIVIDSAIYDKTNKQINFITVISSITSFYLFLMFGILRPWLEEFYGKQLQTDAFVNSANQIINSLWIIGLIFLIIAAISTIPWNKFELEERKLQVLNQLWGKSNIIIALVSIIVIAGISLIILALISKNDSNYNPDFGSLIGGALGGIGTLIAVFFTLKHNQIAQDHLRHDAIRPYIKAWHLNDADEGMNYYKNVPRYDFVYSPNDKVFLKKVKFAPREDTFIRELVIENVGQGVAVELEINIENAQGCRYGTNDKIALGAGKTEVYSFLVRKEFLKPDKYKMVFDYQDIMKKKYSQEIEFEIVKDLSAETGMNLKDFIRISHQQER